MLLRPRLLLELGKFLHNVVLQLLLIHILNSFDHYILTVGVLGPPIFRIIIIIDVHIIIVDNLNDLGRRALSKLHVSQAHGVQLSLELRVVDVAALRIVVVRGALLIGIVLAVLISIRTAISRINSTNGFGVKDIFV